MITTFPQYIKDFKCYASACRDTCCAGWQIIIDDDTYKIYKKDPHFSCIAKNIQIDNEEISFNNICGKCPCLDDKNLCIITSEFGEGFTPSTCRKYPEFSINLGSRKELGLSLSCPAALDLFLKYDFILCNEFSDEEPELNEIDAERYFYLSNKRKAMLDNPIINYKIDFNLLNLEYLNQYIPQLLNSKKQIRNCDDNLKTKLYNYFVYKYYFYALFDDEIKVNNFIIACYSQLIKLIENNEEPVDEIIQKFCKEIEHSDINLDILMNLE